MSPLPPASPARRAAFAGANLLAPADEVAAVLDRAADWNTTLRPDTPFQRWKAEWAAILATGLDTAYAEAIALRDEAARRAAESWDADRRLAAEELAAR